MSDQSLSILLPLLRAGDPDATAQVWRHFYDRLVSLANRKLAERVKRIVNGEDVAQSAFKSCFRAIVEGRVPDLRNRRNLWAFLATITVRKACSVNVHHHTEKNGGGKVLGESAFEVPADSINRGIASVEGKDRSVESVFEMDEKLELLLNTVDDDARQVAILHLHGMRNHEISATLGFSLAKVERKLNKIRRIGRRIEAHINSHAPRD